jgi:hypothetical protein
LVRNPLAESEQWHVGLDFEWGLIYNAAGIIIGLKKLALIQVGYFLNERYDARVFQVAFHNTLPARLEAFLLDIRSTFTGCQVGGDISKIFRTFKKDDKTRDVARLELGSYAKNRCVVASGTVKMKSST